jgi:hypothetical protein
MKEFRFKVLRNGDELYSFSSTEMIIKEESGNFRVYKVLDFDTGNPQFSKEFEKISVHLGSVFNDSVVVVEKSGTTVIYKIDSFKNKLPILNHDFVILISKGIGKIEVFDSETRISYQLPAKEEC